MCLHEVVAFGLFAGPLFHMLEKLLNIQHKGYWICTSVQFVIVAILLFFAVAFPFFGVINGLLGAFTTTFCTYVCDPHHCVQQILQYGGQVQRQNQKNVAGSKLHDNEDYKLDYYCHVYNIWFWFWWMGFTISSR